MASNVPNSTVFNDSPSLQMQREELEKFSLASAGTSNDEKTPLPENEGVGVECDSTNTAYSPTLHSEVFQPESSVGQPPSGFPQPSASGVQESQYISGKSSQVLPQPEALKHLHSPPPSYFNEPERSYTGNQSLGDDKKEDLNLVATYGVGLPSREHLNLPLCQLSFESRRQLGLHMDPDRATVPNWRSMADRLEFSNLEIRNFESERCKTDAVLFVYESRNPSATVGDLYNILEDLERHDVITDLEERFARDHEKWKRKSSLPSPGVLADVKYRSSPISPAPSYRTTEYHNLASPMEFQDSSISTTDPIEDWLPDEYYDGFVMYDPADKDFILNDFLPKVEDECKMKLFLPQRDMTAGVQFFQKQLNAMMTRCNKLVVILSDEFLTSSQSQWALNAGVSLDPASRLRKIVPVIYKKITKPNILGGYNACDRTRVLKDEWFWNSLIKSLQKERALSGNLS